MTKVYKVVRESGGELYSYVVPKGSGRVHYVPGKDTRTNNGTPLLAFKTERDARNFIGGSTYSSSQIWKAEAKETTYVGVILWVMGLRQEIIRRFWSGKPALRLPMRHPPHGTVACKTIKLVERVA